ncbi:MAG TPA: MoaD/ThiS family protein [Pirellulaceae bacterium]|nr:MoaD/ThiS family protein [Pirellulaceae bacterium]
MAVAVHIPVPLRVYCDGARELEVEAATVQGALHQLRERYPAVYLGVCDETGAVRRHINLFVNQTLVRRPDGLETPLSAGDMLLVLPAVSGG